MLAHLLLEWTRARNVKLYAFIVDHGLRPESTAEAKRVAKNLKAFGIQNVKILTWDGVKPKTRLQEQARKKRYELLTKACRAHGISHLCTAHHGDDQMETFLMRLKRGSGLKGLLGMDARTELSGIYILRPLLDLTHEDAVSYCSHKKIPWMEDPSNQNTQYERVRIRNLLPSLKQQDITVAMLSLTLARLMQSYHALSYYVEKEEKNYCVESKSQRVVYRLDLVTQVPFEILVQILIRAIVKIAGKKDYAPSLAGVENVARRIGADEKFRAASLGGVTIRVSRTRKTLEITGNPPT